MKLKQPLHIDWTLLPEVSEKALQSLSALAH